jgi:hypothetical protein
MLAVAVALGAAAPDAVVAGSPSTAPPLARGSDLPARANAVSGFPRWDRRYHDYGEMVAHIRAVAAAHPDIVRLLAIGRSARGRTIWAAKVSDHVGVDEPEPEVLFDGLHHADEHLTVEMTLSILDLLATNHGRSTPLGRRVTAVVNSRETWIVFMVNPDGGEYDIQDGWYHGWRKNRQPNAGTSAVGTDLNRNYGYRWGCCRGSSRQPSSALYRGAAPFSAPETRAIRDLVLSRVVGGVQQIRVAITFHIPGRLVLWPYGYTAEDTPPDMTAADHRAFVALGTAMAKRNGYAPMQWGDGRRVSGVAIDWLYGSQRIFAFLVELGTSMSIPDERIVAETTRNHGAVLYLMEQADCPYRSIGKGGQLCGALYDDFEADRGWTAVANDGAATAVRAGIADAPSRVAWSQRAARGRLDDPPAARSGRAVMALQSVDATVAGRPGRAAVRSPVVRLPGAGASLRLAWWARFGPAATAADRFEVRLVAPDGEVLATALRATADTVRGVARWRALDVPVPPALAGRRAAVELRATVTGASSLRVAVDDVVITQARAPAAGPAVRDGPAAL